MQVQKVNCTYTGKSYPSTNVKSSKKVTFKGFHKVLENVCERDLKDLTYVSSAFRDIFSSLRSTPGIYKSPDLALIEKYLQSCRSISDFMETLCAPIAKVPSDLRDLIFKSEEEHITLMGKNDYGNLVMHTSGKIGFLNTIFNNQDARNNVTLSFNDNCFRSFDIGMTKGGCVTTDQRNYHYYKHSEFGILNRRKYKEGNITDSLPIFPPY